MKQCMFCGQIAEMIWVHGHYQCSRCHQVTVPCCNGETAGNANTSQAASARREQPGSRRYSEIG